jgi:hypothetical protein
MAASDYVPIFFKNRLHLAGRPQMSTRPIICPLRWVRRPGSVLAVLRIEISLVESARQAYSATCSMLEDRVRRRSCEPTTRILAVPATRKCKLSGRS